MDCTEFQGRKFRIAENIGECALTKMSFYCFAHSVAQICAHTWHYESNNLFCKVQTAYSSIRLEPDLPCRESFILFAYTSTSRSLIIYQCNCCCYFGYSPSSIRFISHWTHTRIVVRSLFYLFGMSLCGNEAIIVVFVFTCGYFGARARVCVSVYTTLTPSHAAHSCPAIGSDDFRSHSNTRITIFIYRCPYQFGCRRRFRHSPTP